MKVKKFSEVSRTAWNTVYEKSDDAWIFHCHEWVELESRFFGEMNLSFALEGEEGACLGIHPLYLRKSGLEEWVETVLDCGIHRHTGLALLDSLNHRRKAVLRDMAMQHIFKLAEQFDVDRIQLNAHNLAPRNLSTKREEIPFWVVDYHFHLGLHFNSKGYNPVPGMASCCADQIVSLEGVSTEILFRQLEESCQRAIRKALKSNLATGFMEGDEAILEYYRLARISSERTGESLPPCEYYDEIFSNFHPLGKCEVLFAMHDSKKVAALLLLMDKRSVNFLAGTSDPEYLSLRVNDFLHWSAIQWAKEKGFHYYRLGPIFPEVPKAWRLYQVSRFKKKFGGKSFNTIQGSYFRKLESYLTNGRKETEAYWDALEEETARR